MIERPIPIGGFTGYDDGIDEPEPGTAAEAFLREQREEQEHVEDLMAAVFRGPKGREALAYLRRRVDLNIGFDPAAGFHNGAAYGFAREGQRSVIDHIENLIKNSTERK